MARKRRSNRRKNFVALPFNTTVVLDTLANGAVIAADLLASLSEDLYVISVDGTWAMLGHTAGEGPIHVGYAHGDLSVTEIGENLTADLSNPDDIIQKERSRRPVRRAGSFPGLSTEEVLNNGVPLRTTIKFTIGDGNSFDIWAQNVSGATLTTGCTVRLDGTVYGRWLR